MGEVRLRLRKSCDSHNYSYFPGIILMCYDIETK